MKRVAVDVGDQVFGSEGGEEFGAVRQVRESDLVIDVEGFGEVTVLASVVTAVHDGKVIVDVKRLPREVRHAVGHAHDSEE